MGKPHLSRIRIYPIKSFDPVELQEAEIGVYSLKHDRTFALLAEDGRYINGKRTGLVNQLKAKFDLPNQRITLSKRNSGNTQTFDLHESNEELLEFLQDYFGMKLFLSHRMHGELMDVPKASSVTVVSKASLESLQTDLKSESLEDVRLRFRANIEIEGVDAYWEEKLFNTPTAGVRFSIGDVEMTGVSPRARCNVPPRNPQTGDPDKTFVKKMMESRARSLPEDSTLPQFGNLYHLSVDTYIAPNQEGKVISVGDPVTIIGSVNLDE